MRREMMTACVVAIAAAAMIAPAFLLAAPGASPSSDATTPPASLDASTPPASLDASTPPAAPITEATVDRDGIRAVLRSLVPTVEVGEPLTLRLEVEAPTSASILFPSPAAPGSPRPTLGEFELRSARMLPPDPARPSWRAQDIEVVTFAAGLQEIPPIELRRDGAAGSSPLLVGPLRIEVTSLVGDTDDPRAALRPVKEAVEIALPRDWRMIAIIGAAAMVLLVAGAAAWRRLRRTAPVRVIAPHEEAHAALVQLRNEDLPGHGRVLEFYVRLSDIVRRYVERRFGIRAPEQTTKEFLAAASRHPSIVEGHRVLLSGFMRTADRVKFAAERPGRDDCVRAFEAADGFVDETTLEEDSSAAPESSSPRSDGREGVTA